MQNCIVKRLFNIAIFVSWAQNTMPGFDEGWKKDKQTVDETHIKVKVVCQ